MIIAALKPTITLTPNHGYVGQAITVAGQGVASQPGVRVVWLLDEATFSAAVVARHSDNSYQATITVPNGVGQGSVQVCATVTETTQAEFTCKLVAPVIIPVGNTACATRVRDAQPIGTSHGLASREACFWTIP